MIGHPLLSASLCDPCNNTVDGRIQHRVSFRDLVVHLDTSDDIELQTGGSIWHAGYELASYLIEHPELVRGKRVVEIGCGCGLVGIVAGALGAKSVLLTDLDIQLPVIQRNISLNQGLFDGSGSEVTAACFRFGSSVDALIDTDCMTIDIILGADIGYGIELYRPIVSSLESIVAGRCCSMILLAEEIRWKDIYNWYRECLESSFADVQLVASLHPNAMRTTKVDILCIDLTLDNGESSL
jgi:hypothetical protein